MSLRFTTSLPVIREILAFFFISVLGKEWSFTVGSSESV